MTTKRPPFIVSTNDVPEKTHSYPDSDEKMSPGRAIGKQAGMRRIGLHVERVVPGSRTSFPHAEELEEEFAYVLEGELDVWVDGTIHHIVKGDLVAFPAGTGIAHTFLNDGEHDALLLVGGEGNKPDNRIVYPLNQERRAQMPWSHWWEDAPNRELGSHDGMPAAIRKKTP